MKKFLGDSGDPCANPSGGGLTQILGGGVTVAFYEIFTLTNARFAL